MPGKVQVSQKFYIRFTFSFRTVARMSVQAVKQFYRRKLPEKCVSFSSLEGNVDLMNILKEIQLKMFFMKHTFLLVSRHDETYQMRCYDHECNLFVCLI